MRDRITKTEYFQEYLDFGYLWMRDKGLSVSDHKPRPENAELWKGLREVLPGDFFEVCPMHWLGNLLDRGRRGSANRTHPLVLAVSFQPGRTLAPEERENALGLFTNFDKLENDCTSYFTSVYEPPKGIPITGNQFWRNIARVVFRVANEETMEQNNAGVKRRQCFEAIVNNLVHIDLWPLRAPSFAVFKRYVLDNPNLPERFKIEKRNQMVRDFVGGVDPDVTLLVGKDVTLGEDDWIEFPEVVDTSGRRNVWRSANLPRCFQIFHPNTRGMTNSNWDNIGARIRQALHESP